MPFHKVSPYFQMTKPTISCMVAFTVLPTLFMSSEVIPSGALVFWTLLGTYLASSSAAIFNHLVDSDLDKSMERTKRRPIPSGKVSQGPAVSLAVGLGVVSFFLLWHEVNLLTALVSLFANFFYVVIYTIWLKPRTHQNIVIGGVAGAVGPLIGCAAVTGAISWEAWVLFLIICLWTPPHFWALALKYKDDYSVANIPMLPVVKGERATRSQILAYTLILIPVSVSLAVVGGAGLGYLIVSAVASCYFAWLAFKLFRLKAVQHAMPVFFFSLAYVFIIFGALTIEQLVLKL